MNVFSVGAWGLPAHERKGTPGGDTPDGILGGVRRLLMALVDRLAPDELYQDVTMDSVPIGEIVGTVTVEKPFNAFQVSLRTGEIDVYFGESYANVVPDMHFGPTLNPVNVHFPKLNYNRITIVVSGDSPEPAYGKLKIMCY